MPCQHVRGDGCHAIRYPLPDMSSSHALPACQATDTYLRGNRHHKSVEYVQERLVSDSILDLLWYTGQAYLGQAT
ncbi:hypothetical protein J6590_090178 [Homalodisca vitripennis]|nr:hypothetical protein J6590_090178 [Homalodisca vitripennis]